MKLYTVEYRIFVRETSELTPNSFDEIYAFPNQDIAVRLAEILQKKLQLVDVKYQILIVDYYESN